MKYLGFPEDRQLLLLLSSCSHRARGNILSGQGAGHNRVAETQSFGAQTKMESMMTGKLKSQVDSAWNAFLVRCISNPMEVIEQITYLLLLKRLADNHTAAERKAQRTKKPIEIPIFPEGTDKFSRSHQDMRCVGRSSRISIKTEMFQIFSESVFPFLREELTLSRGRIKPDARTLPTYLNWATPSDNARRYFMCCAKQTTGTASINRTQLSATPIAVSPLDLQRKFENRLSAIEALKSAYQV